MKNYVIVGAMVAVGIGSMFVPQTGNIFLIILMFAVGLALLIKGGDVFVDGATSIAERFRIPEILIGATVVSIGTTLPEVMVSATAAVGGSGQIAYGNAIGSVICNTALIAAITVAVKPTETDRKALIIPVIFFFVSAVFYTFCACVFNRFDRWMGIVLLAIFVVYIVMSSVQAKKSLPLMGEKGEAAAEKASAADIIKDIIIIVAGAFAIAMGANLLVDNGKALAQMAGVSDAVIGLTVIALGTSLPELITAITSLIKGHSSLSLGNLIGANLFNIVLVSGMAVTLSPFDVPMQEFFGLNRTFIIDIPVMFGVMALLTLPPLIKGKLSRWQGIVLLVIYAAFCAVQFIFGQV